MNLRKGNAHVKEWMEEHCKVQMTSTDAGTFKMKHALGEYCKYISGRKGAGDGTVQLDELVVSGLSHLQLSYFGFRYTVCCVDATVWPSDAQYVAECLDLVNNVCSMGQTNVGHVQVPLYHSGTTVSALLKHRRKLEDCLLKADMDITNTLTLVFAKESARATTDKRPITQQVITPYAGKTCKWMESEALQNSVVGPLPLLRVSEMQGYDPEGGARPGAAARLEQKLDLVEPA